MGAGAHLQQGNAGVGQMSENEQEEMDTVLLEVILAEETGTIANIIQAASELEGSLYERLSAGYYELTNKDPGADTDGIGLK